MYKAHLGLPFPPADPRERQGFAHQRGYLIVGGGVLAGSFGCAVGHRQLEDLKQHLRQLLAGAQVQLRLAAQLPDLLPQLLKSPLQGRLCMQKRAMKHRSV